MEPRQMKPLNELKEWSKNPRSINNDAFARLKDQIELKGQYKPLLIVPSAAEGYIVLGGNMRLKALRELGIAEAWVTIVDFILLDSDGTSPGLWKAVVNGQRQKETFQTKEDGMMAYSLSDNDRAGYYDAELMANIMPEFNLDWNTYAVDFDEPETIANFTANVGDGSDALTGNYRYQIIVDCDNEQMQKELHSSLAQNGYKVEAKARPIKEKK